MNCLLRAASALLSLTLLCGAPAAPASAEEAAPLSIIATIFPAYDFARQLAGNTAHVSLLLPPGSESHSYEPSPKDMIAIQQADLFLYAGGESDHWVDELLASLGDDAPRVFRLSDSVSLLEEQASASMEDGHEHGSGDHAHDESESPELDEHVWTSPKNVMLIARDLCGTLSEIAPGSAAHYRRALDDYLAQLEELDAAFEKTVAEGKRDIIIFGDRFPFRYFAHDYGLRYDAAFPGCSEDSEPSVRTVISLVDTVREQGIPVVFYLEFSSRRTADILAEETGAKELLFHSCHNVSAGELAAGVSYLSLMWQNVEALKEALS